MDDGQCARSVSDLVEQHYALLYRYAYRLTGSSVEAEDLTQQTFLSAQARLDQLRDFQHAKSWMCTILRNTYLKQLRSRPSGHVVSLDNVPEPADSTIEDFSVDPEELQAALNELPEEFRTPLVLFYFEDFSYKDIAVQMDVPIGTVMSRLARAKSHLRKRLGAAQPATRHA
jgi:RNA polymerase sigma-70 factor, ECF subfamily